MAISGLPTQRCLVGNLVVEAYDADNNTPTMYTNIVTSAVKPSDNSLAHLTGMKELGTVFKIRAKGYQYYIDNDLDAAAKIHFEGASRLVLYPASTGTGYPKSVSPVLGFRRGSSGIQVLSFGVGYLNAETYYNTSGLLSHAIGTGPADGYFYATLIAEPNYYAGNESGHTVSITFANNPEFTLSTGQSYLGSLQTQLERFEGEPFISPMLTFTTAPAFDKNQFQSGMAMGLTGKGNPTFAATDSFTRGYLAGAELRNKRAMKLQGT